MRRVACAFALLVAGGTASSATVSGEIALKTLGGFPVVEAFVNSRGPFNLLVDTGTRISVLSPDAANKAQLEAEQPIRIVTPMGSRMARIGTAVVTFGRSVQMTTRFSVHALPVNEFLSMHLDGVLGQEFLGQQPYLIDLKARRLCLGEELARRGVDLGPPVQVRVSEGRILVPTSIGRSREVLNLILDSGTDTLLVKCGAGCPTVMSARPITMLTNSGSSLLIGGWLTRIHVGELPISDVPSIVMHGKGTTEENDGLLPLRLLKTVYVDAPRGIVRFPKSLQGI